MDKRKVGILTFSDGRDFAHKLQYDMNKEFQDRLTDALAPKGEIVRLSSEVPQGNVTNAREWLEKMAGEVRYNGEALTPEKLELQIRSYYAVRQMIDQWDLDFVGIKGQPEMTNNFATMDIAEAFLNDPYDWDGPHEPIVCATEADSDAALTMEIFKHIARTPVLFADLRHHDAEYDFWDLVNSGQHATYCSGRSFKPEENMPYAFARFKVPPETFIDTYSSNHIHGVYGNYVEELAWACMILDIDYTIYS